MNTLEKNVKTDQLIINKCYNCGDKNDLLPLNDYEHNFNNKSKKHNGILCNKCKCFHYLDKNGNVTYEYNYKDSLTTDDNVKWSISDN